jgi:hypothetical protein
MTAAAFPWARLGRFLFLPLLALSLAQCGNDEPQSQAGSCASDSDCSGSRPACDVATGQCVGCVPGGTTCSAGSYCDAAQRVCLTGCAADADCSAGGAALVCDLASRTCVGCVGDRDCGPGTVCKQGRCEPGCTDDHPCRNGMESDRRSNNCHNS